VSFPIQRRKTNSSTVVHVCWRCTLCLTDSARARAFVCVTHVWTITRNGARRTSHDVYFTGPRTFERRRDFLSRGCMDAADERTTSVWIVPRSRACDDYRYCWCAFNIRQIQRYCIILLRCGGRKRLVLTIRQRHDGDGMAIRNPWRPNDKCQIYAFYNIIMWR